MKVNMISTRHHNILNKLLKLSSKVSGVPNVETSLCFMLYFKVENEKKNFISEFSICLLSLLDKWVQDFKTLYTEYYLFDYVCRKVLLHFC